MILKQIQILTFSTKKIRRLSFLREHQLKEDLELIKSYSSKIQSSQKIQILRRNLTCLGISRTSRTWTTSRANKSSNSITSYSKRKTNKKEPIMRVEARWLKIMKIKMYLMYHLIPHLALFSIKKLLLSKSKANRKNNKDYRPLHSKVKKEEPY